MIIVNKYGIFSLKFIIFSLILLLCVILLSARNIKLFVPAMEQSKTGETSVNFIIDPGHGGEDGGATANGVTEKDVNLAVSSYLYDYLSLSKYNAHMTRRDDRLLYNAGEENRKKYHDLVNRVKFASSFDNAVFISIHQNKFEISKYKGLQVYYSPNNSLSESLAKRVQNNTKIYLDTQNNREIKRADNNIRVLSSLKIPAILVECGFISNPEEAEKLSDAEYQKKLAFIVFISALQFLEENGV